MRRFLLVSLLLSLAMPALASHAVVRRDRRRADDDTALLDIDFTSGIYVRKSSGGVQPTFTRASSALEYRVQPARLLGTNEPRIFSTRPELAGILIEGADTNLLTYNTGTSQELIDLRWNNMDNGCLRAFFFEQNCNDEMGVTNGTATDITYDSTGRFWPHGTMLRGLAAVFNGTTSKVSFGSAADIDNLIELTVACWTYCEGPGEASSGRFLDKGNSSGATRFECNAEAGGYVGLFGRILYTGDDAESNKVACLEKNEWHHVAFTYSESGDRKIHIFIDGTEVTGYNTQTASTLVRTSDAADTAFIGNTSDGTCAFDGMITPFLIYNRVLSSTELKWLAQKWGYGGSSGDLEVSMWEKHGVVDPSKITHGMISFQWDDGYATTYTKAKPVFDAAGEVGNIAMVTSLIGVGDRLSAAQLQAFQAAGWEIISHSKTHTTPVVQTDAEARVEFADSKAALEALGLTVKHYAWPYSAPHCAQRQICAEYYESAKDGSLWEELSDINLFCMSGAAIDTPASLATYKGWVDTAYNNNRLLTFVMHDVADDDAAMLAELIAYVQAKPMPIVTRSEVLENIICTPPEPLYNATSMKCQNVSASAQQLYQPKTITAVKHIVSFLAYTDGTAVTAADVVAFADTATTNEVALTNFEHVGGGVYLCWGVFTATAAAWNVGVEVPAGRTVYISLLTCHIAAPANEGGDFPRSPIPNTTGASITRAADNLTIPGTGNIGATEGTIDWEGVVPVTEASMGSTLRHFEFYKNATNYIYTWVNPAGTTTNFYVLMGGAGACTSGAVTATIRGTVLKLRLVYRQPTTLDGTNYAILYRNVGAGWVQLAQSAVQPTGTLDNTGTIYLGMKNDPNRRWGSIIHRVCIKGVAELNPSW